ncbi:acyltransferase [Pseudomonas brassicacearum]|uniref:acyltransferase family protein n=1 Tax=Pseudomonas brassicacearum TaxID=930166 RepID=UPI000F4A24BB|nr:acyltransferase [Pseudomonas brassicacearum]
MSALKHSKNEEIEALRGMAVAIAVISHLGNLLFWNDFFGKTTLAFWGGVDVFFCISGFVIMSAFREKMLTARQSGCGRYWAEVRAFFVRRIYRIIPSAWLWITITCILSVIFNSSGVFGSLKGNIVDFIAIILNVANFHFALCLTHTDGSFLCGGNGQYWSISLEEQFYLIFPLIVLLPKRAIYIVTALVIAGYAIAQQVYGNTSTYTWLTRVDSIFLGVALAVFAQSETFKRLEPAKLKKFARLSAPVLLFLLLMSPYNAKDYHLYPLTVCLFGGCLVLLAAYQKGYLFPEGKLRNLLAYIGARSFAIYLIHNPAFQLTREIWFRISPTGTTFDSAYTVAFLATAFSVIWVCSELNYRLVETPLRERGAKKAKLLAPPVAAL